MPESSFTWKGLLTGEDQAEKANEKEEIAKSGAASRVA
jgi:hypothetical protein